MMQNTGCRLCHWWLVTPRKRMNLDVGDEALKAIISDGRVLSKFRSSKMKTFVRQKSTGTVAVATNIDFGAASAQIARVLDPEVYKLRIESARVVSSKENTLVVLDP